MKVEIVYREKCDTKTIIINAARIEINEKWKWGVEVYVLDVAGEEHRANSGQKHLEEISVDGDTLWRRRERL